MPGLPEALDLQPSRGARIPRGRRLIGLSRSLRLAPVGRDHRDLAAAEPDLAVGVMRLVAHQLDRALVIGGSDIFAAHNVPLAIQAVDTVILQHDPPAGDSISPVTAS